LGEPESHAGVSKRAATFHPPHPLGETDQREKGYMAQPIPTPINKKRISDHTIYFNLSLTPRRLRNPKAIEIASANSVIAWKWFK